MAGRVRPSDLCHKLRSIFLFVQLPPFYTTGVEGLGTPYRVSTKSPTALSLDVQGVSQSRNLPPAPSTCPGPTPGVSSSADPLAPPGPLSCRVRRNTSVGFKFKYLVYEPLDDTRSVPTLV